MKNEKEEKVVEFLNHNIFTRFGVPQETVTYPCHQFTSNMIENPMQLKNLHHVKLSTYNPQANGQVEITNKELENILIEIVQLHKKDWTNRLIGFLWAYLENHQRVHITYEHVNI